MLYQRGKGRICQKNGRQKRERTWWYRFRFAGRIIHESAKTTNINVARDAERTRRRELEEKYNRIKRRALPPSFAQAANAWLEGEKPHLAQRTHAIYHVALKCHLNPVLGSWLLCDVDGCERALVGGGGCPAGTNRARWCSADRYVAFLSDNQQGRASFSRASLVFAGAGASRTARRTPPG